MARTGRGEHTRAAPRPSPPPPNGMLLTVALVTLNLAPAPAATAHRPIPVERAEQKELVVEAYRLRIVATGSDDSLLDREDAEAMAPDAFAGLSKGGGVWAVVIAEFAPGADLNGYLELVSTTTTSLPEAENPWLGEIARAKHHGLAAMERESKVRLSGIDLRFSHRVYQKGDYVFQIVAWGPAINTTGRSLAGVADQFEALPGEVVGRRGAVTLKDADGVGWRQRAGVFESALVGVKVEPKGPWRVVVGSELENLDEVADVGLVSAEPDLYCVLTVYADVGEDAPAVADDLRAVRTAEMEGTPAGDPVELELAGAPLSLAPFDVEMGVTYRFLHGVAIVDGNAVEVQAWCSAALADLCLESLPVALGGVSFLGEGPRTRLEAELLAAPDPEVSIGPDFALRGGTYTDFAHGFRISKPLGFWDFDGGARARAGSQGVRLTFRKVEAGLEGFIEVVPWPGESLVDAHRTALVDEWELYGSLDDVPEHQATELGGVPFVSSIHQSGDGANGTYGALQVFTALMDGHRVEISVEASYPGLEFHRDDITKLLASFEVTDMTMVSRKPDSFIDRRIGYELRRPEADWKGEDVDVPPALGSSSSGYRWSGGRGRSVMVMGIGLDDSMTGSAPMKTIARSMARELGGKITRRSEEVLGVSVEIVESRRLFRREIFALVPMRGRFFLVSCTGGRSDDLLALMERSLVVLD